MFVGDDMAFKPKPTKAKVAAVYKSIYIREELVKEIEKIAKENNTSFNNVVISMIEECLKKINFYIKSLKLFIFQAFIHLLLFYLIVYLQFL